MRNSWIQWLLTAIATFAVSAALPAAEPPVRFDTTGGDAWTFDKYVTGRVSVADCDEVLVESPAGAGIALITDDRFSVEVPLRSGMNEIQALCKSKDNEVARSNPQRWLNRIDDKPRAWTRVRVDGETVLMDAGRSQPAEGIAAPIKQYEWRARAGNSAPLTLTSDAPSLDIAAVTTESVQIRSPTKDGEYYVTLRVTDALGRSDESTAVFQVVGGNPKEVDLAHHRPAWTRDAVLYGVSPFVFRKQSYEEIRARLREISQLGATVIWLSPITAAPSDDFGYAVTDHFRSRLDFGPEKQLRALIDTAHAFGLRVIMDFVPNHFSTEHRYYIDAADQQTASPYFSWFERDDEGQPTHYFDWEHLKNLEYDHPEVQRYMIEAFAHWVREFGVDGFRVDVSWGVRERAPEFWPRWREELKRIDPDLLLIAESSARDGYYFSHGFDAAYDWTEQLGQWAWHDVFVGAGSLPKLDVLRAALKSSSVDLPVHGTVLRFLNNNDTGERFITRHGVHQTRVAAAMLLTLPGLPLIYNGDEVGAEFQPYEEQPIAWRDRHKLTAYYTRLAQLRRSFPALSSPELELIKTDRNDAVLAYIRRPMPGAHRPTAGCHDDRHALVLLNFSRETVDVQLPQSPSVAEIVGANQLQDVLTAEPVAASSNRVHLEPFDARVLASADSPCASVVSELR
jgi:cyclomaltodextrinase / maltogenic alpha-amylase / neopullulanase